MARTRKSLEAATAAARTVWSILGVTLLLLLTVDLVAEAVIYVVENQKIADSRVRADAFDGKPWAASYFEEEWASTGELVWTPYTYWRRAPFNGTYINVDRDGLRATWDPPANGKTDRPIRVFLFGGSTMVGTGAPDDGTIPSWLAKLLAQSIGSPFSVVNFGHQGYVSSQEVIVLQEELKRGNRPDIAVFYDGVNDTYSALQNRAAGMPQNEIKRAREFNLLVDVDFPNRARLYREALFTAWRNSGLGILAGVASKLSIDDYIAGRIRTSLMGSPLEHLPTAGSLDELAAATVENYLANVHLVEVLAEAYGFRALFYWQPTVFTKAKKTPYEETQEKAITVYNGIPLPMLPDMRAFFLDVDRRVTAAAGGAGAASVRNISNVFGSDGTPYFIDFCHLDAAGNALVAQSMHPDVQQAIASVEAERHRLASRR